MNKPTTKLALRIAQICRQAPGVHSFEVISNGEIPVALVYHGQAAVEPLDEQSKRGKLQSPSDAAPPAAVDGSPPRRRQSVS